ncbi:multidrug efflux RND transporter permease subunit [Luteibacter rhizovicinus DSM 16549]|uniref:Efflux pump membrane transporter n=1 Tax=Luteibacter rhizovicinus DSM 16549 TaxID=1440763 RepID=A0A0G9HGE0_9GAMM|nr:multidrug efflux RND transporter permease subunit [Luteibacter rhizovicinus]APG03615.1 multidrug efflux RND transporter permease subunit [Luteibacter rhizovicinus DSM 16549]KLD68778.1 transporter [Luteibacter rhizovicinus DSM 16549]
MKIAQYFVERPILAGVLSVLFLIAGGIAVFKLPISEYPEVVPPTVVVKASYPGANPKVIAETVATPLEEQINGVEGMLYTSSQSTSDGQMTLTVTFALGTDLDNAQVQTQNRVSQALPRLPEEVQRLGVTTTKSSPDLTMVVHLTSPDSRYDMLYLSNYARTRIKDQLARLDGVGDVQLFGAGEYSMRVWMNPEKLAIRNLTTGDVIKAVREQNIEVAAGALNAPPGPNSNAFQVNINTQGRLVTEDDFLNIIVRSDPTGSVTHLRDVARVELGSNNYALRSLLNNREAVAIPIFQRPGSNAIAISDEVRAEMATLKKDFPQGVDYTIVYDPTVFVRGSIEAVVHTLFEAIILVVLVVILFLQTWRASIIPLVAVPVSLIGTFAVMYLVGFSLNALSLFGLVLAIGIVVDDAIVVVENVERHIEHGLDPKMATRQAMTEVTGPIVATALVLCAVFVPAAFISGLTGQFYRQFALTIAISTVISAFNSLTLSPALAALLLKGRDEPKDKLTVMMDRGLGWIFRPFNRTFERASNGYVGGVKKILRFAVVMLVLYAGLVGLGVLGFARTPTGFVPPQDKQYLVAFAQLPDAASLDRTETVIREMGDIALKDPGAASAVQFPGLSINGFTNSTNSGIVFVTLKPFEERRDKDLSADAIVARLNAKFASIQGAYIAIFPPPPVNGLGTIGGFRVQLEDRGDLGFDELYKQTQGIIGASQKTPELAHLFSSFQVNVPQFDADIDREKAKSEGIDLGDVFQTMQAYLGSLYVNDFNRFGRTYQVNVSAEPSFRHEPSDVVGLKTRNAAGDLVPLGSFLTMRQTNGPDRVQHYNGYPTAEINGGAAPGYSTGQAQDAMEKLLATSLPNGMSYEWTELTYQQILAGNTAVLVFPLSVLLVFLVLASLYESLSLPLAVILIVPMVLLSAIAGVIVTGGDNNIFTQIGLIVLVGLACKNAILIVEFAREAEIEGMNRVDAVLEAARLRLRPILMTSFAFIMGVVPLVTSHGAGAEMRHAMGVAVFAGMLGVTFFGLIFTPLFYVLIRGWNERQAANRAARRERRLLEHAARES